MKESLFIWGTPISEGIVTGVPYHLEASSLSIPKSQGSVDADREITKYRSAILASKSELLNLQKFLERNGDDESLSIIHSHINILEDPFITSDMEEQIINRSESAEMVFFDFFRDCLSTLYGDALSDMKDLSKRIFKHLNLTLEKKHPPQGAIVCSYEVFPSQILELDNVAGIVTNVGGSGTHVAIIAKSKRIPFISNVDIKQILSKGEILLDGFSGSIVINPAPYCAEKYATPNRGDNSLAITRDGHKIEIAANVEGMNDIHLLNVYNVDVIGLLRTEFFYFKNDVKDFDEEEQFFLYKKIISLSEGVEIFFRLFDFGSDKRLHGQKEPNPALGKRSLRFSLEHPNFFSSQVRAILRASLFGNVKLLLPFISDFDELISVKSFIKKLSIELINEGLNISLPKIGCMVEVPSFVIMCDQMISEVDFLSIGTNDLIQYTLAVDRERPSILYNPLQPSIIRMISIVAQEANKREVAVSVCGEMASNRLLSEILIGLGIRKLSCRLGVIPEIRKSIRRISLSDSQELAKELLLCKSSREVSMVMERRGRGG